MMVKPVTEKQYDGGQSTEHFPLASYIYPVISSASLVCVPTRFCHDADVELQPRGHFCSLAIGDAGHTAKRGHSCLSSPKQAQQQSIHNLQRHVNLSEPQSHTCIESTHKDMDEKTGSSNEEGSFSIRCVIAKI